MLNNQYLKFYYSKGFSLSQRHWVYSTDLDDNTADLKIPFRMTNLSGLAGRDAIPTFTASNFEITTVPLPPSLVFLGSGLLGLLGLRRKLT
jgi:hypothetical protein